MDECVTSSAGICGRDLGDYGNHVTAREADVGWEARWEVEGGRRGVDNVHQSVGFALSKTNKQTKKEN